MLPLAMGPQSGTSARAGLMQGEGGVENENTARSWILRTTRTRGPGGGMNVDDNPPGLDRERSHLDQKQDQVRAKDDESRMDGRPQTFRPCLNRDINRQMMMSV